MCSQQRSLRRAQLIVAGVLGRKAGEDKATTCWQLREWGGRPATTLGKMFTGKIPSAPFYSWDRELQERTVILPEVTVNMLHVFKQRGEGNTGFFSPSAASTSAFRLRLFLKSSITGRILFCGTP